MMKSLEHIKAPIRQELMDFEAGFKKMMKSDIPLLGIILNYIYRTKGKQIRPMFVYLSAAMFGKPNELTQVAASSVELLHTATLVHDDVVDESYERRGVFSVKALWRNKLAVLVGDYILARGLLLQLQYGQYQFLQLISRAVQDMSEGEILQIKKSRKPDIDIETYYDITRKKTASLIATSMAIGVSSVSDDSRLIDKIYEIGQNAGIAFQIRDDIFDYQEKGIIGKPTGNDIKEKKITLPLLYLLHNSPAAERHRILRLIRNKNKSTAAVRELVLRVERHGGIDFATRQMNQFREKAIEGLKEFPANEARDSLIALMNYITERAK